MEPSTPRLDEIDVVRGLALGGMLLVNLGAFSGAALIPLARQAGMDWLASFLVLLLAEGKFYPLFAFLFGWGVACQQAIIGGERPVFFWNNLRRMAVLALFGLLHAALLWEGDILLAYAVLGLFLPLLHRVPARIIIGFSIFALLLSTLLEMPGAGQPLLYAYRDWIDPPLRANPGHPGSLAALAAIPRHIDLYMWKLAYFPTWLGNFAALIVLGYLAGRSRVSWTVPLWSVLLLAIPLNLFYALASVEPRLLPVDWAGFLRTAALSLGGPLLALAYALRIARWYRSRREKTWLEPLRKIGRMPLTTYLGQSLVGVALFGRVAPGEFSPALVWLVAGAIFILQLFFARRWMERYSRGPCEMAWRWMSDNAWGASTQAKVKKPGKAGLASRH